MCFFLDWETPVDALASFLTQQQETLNIPQPTFSLLRWGIAIMKPVEMLFAYLPILFGATSSKNHVQAVSV